MKSNKLLSPSWLSVLWSICCILLVTAVNAQRTGTIGSIENFESNQTYWVRSARLSDDHVIIVYKAAVSGASSTTADIFSRVGKVDTATKSITWGPVATITTNDNISPFVIGISETQAVIAYEYSVGVADIGVTRVITISDSTITAIGDTNQFSSGDMTSIGGCHLGSGKIVIAYDDKEDSGKGTAVVGDISGTSITYGATQVFSSTEVGPTIVKPISSTRFVMAYEDEGTTNDPAEAMVVDVSGTTLTFGTPAQITASAYVSSKVGLALLSSSTIVVAYGDDAASEEGMVRVGTISGSSITFGGSAVEFASNVNIVNDIYIEETTGDEFLIQYTGTVSSDSAYYLVAERSGNSFTFGDKVAYLNKQTDDQRILRLTDDSFVGTFTEEQNSDIGGSFVGTLSSASSPVSINISSSSNIDCNGAFTGSITATSTPGTANYDYQWSNGATTINTASLTNTISNLSAGTYTVTVTDNNGNTATTSATITQPSTLVSSAAVTNALNCNGSIDGQITASATGGTSPFTYSWNTGGTAALETNLGAGTYSVTITDQNGCTDSASTTVTQPTTLVASAAPVNDVSCNGLADAAAEASATGGTGSYTYSWSNGATTATTIYITAGTYSVTITDQNGCTDSASTIITEPTVLNVSVTAQTNVSCNGASSGSATVVGSGGSSAYTYAWSNGATTGSISNLTTGTYTVTVSDGRNCTNSTSVTISEPTALASAAAVTSPLSCNGLTDGQITASATGGTSPYTYSWNTGGTSALETNLGASTYSVTITDQNGCTDSTSTIVAQPATLIAAALVDNDVSVFGGSDGQITGSATGGTTTYTYAWSNGATSATTTNLSAGTYSITITDQNGCTDSASTIVSQPPSFSSSAVVDANISCNGFSDGSATASPIGGITPYAYLWSNGSNNATVSGLVAGTYTVTITDGNSLTATTSVTITQPSALIAASVVDSNISCNGFSDGGASASAAGGTMPYTYAWSNAATTASITGVVAGTYTVTVSDANGCSSTSSATITEPTALVAASVVDSNTTCNGFSDGGATASAAGGTMPYTYAWSNAATTASITGVVAGTYTVTVSDNNGCTSTSSATITEPSALIAASVVDSNISCNGFSDGGASASAAGGTMPYTYAWSNSATTASITGVVAGTYSVTISDNNGCTSTSSATITEPSALIAASVVDSNTTCNGFSDGGASASAAGGTMPYTYAWSNAATTASITGVVAGTYSVTVSDNSGCTSSSSATITEPAAIVVASVVDSNISCNGFTDGGATTSATGGTTPYTYAWSNAATTASITGVAAGTYTITITSADGCTSTSSTTITQPAALIAVSVIDSNISCNGFSDGGATASATGGTMPYTYAWFNAATTASITGVVAGTYSVTVSDNNGCTSTSSSTVIQPTALVATVVLDSNESCLNTNDGGLTASGTGGTTPFSYLWSNAATTASIDGLTAGTYSVTITDANGCSATSSASITHGLATSGSITVTQCDSYTSPSGNYTWNASGTYFDTISNSIGCDSNLTINLTILNSTTFTRNITSCDSYTSINGMFIYTQSGTYTETIPNGVGCDSVVTTNLTIVHSTDSTLMVTACQEYTSPSGDHTWNTSGTYSDVIANNAGCDSNLTIVLSIINSSSFSQMVTICKGETFAIGSSAYSIAGTYMDTLVNTVGCDSIVTTELIVDQVDVNLSQSGFTLTADNANGTYQWIYCDSNNLPIPGATDQSYTALVSGNYAVVITDNNNNCTDTSACTLVDGVGIIDITKDIAVKVFPNPAGADLSSVTIEVENLTDYQIVIRDIAGKVVFNKEHLNLKSNTIDISRFAAGSFFIEVKTDNNSSFSKLIVL